MNNVSLGNEWKSYLELKDNRPSLFVNTGSISIVFDEEIILKFQQENGRKIGVLYESSYNMLVVDLVYEKDKYYAYERVVPKEKEPGVVIVPKYKNRFILLKQYRHAIRDYQYAFPRGYGENKISIEDNVAKEMREEIGAEISQIKYLGEVVPDSGLSSNKALVYICEVEKYMPMCNNEGIDKIIEITYEEAEAMVKKGQINDGFTLSAFYLYKMQTTIK